MSSSFDIATINPLRILVVGDWHRNIHAAFPKKVVAYAKSIGIEVILHVGDFGYKYGVRGNDAYMFEKPLHRALQEAGIQLVWVDGNHENHEYLRALPLLPNGFAQTGARGNIYYAPRGLRWQWSGRTFGALGGALSINAARLQEGVTLFADLEEPTYEDLDKLGKDKLDYLVCHDVPMRVALKSIFGVPVKSETRIVLQKAVDTLKPERVFSGHWHQRSDFRIPRDDDGETFGHILDKEFTVGNILILNLEDNTIENPPANWQEQN